MRPLIVAMLIGTALTAGCGVSPYRHIGTPSPDPTPVHGANHRGR